MARTAARSGEVSPSATVLVESKLAPPQLSLSLLERNRLSALLHAGLMRRVISVTAAAGYGKTTAISQRLSCCWSRSGDPRAAELLHAEDNDPSHFVRYVAAALHHADPRLGRSALAQIEGGSMASLDAVVASLLHDLMGHERRLMLVLDDFHLVHNETVHRKLEWLLAHLPPTAGLLLASRTRLPLSLSQLRLRGELLELGASHFGLELDEAADFVGRVGGRRWRAARFGPCTNSPRAGSRACNSLRSRCAKARTRTPSSLPSRAPIATSPTISANRCSTACGPSCATSCSARPASSASAPSSATKCCSAATAARCLPRSRHATCSSRGSIARAPGSGTTISSPTTCEAAPRSGPRKHRAPCACVRATGSTATGCRTRPSVTPSTDKTSNAPPIWSRSSRRSSSSIAANMRRCSVG